MRRTFIRGSFPVSLLLSAVWICITATPSMAEEFVRIPASQTKSFMSGVTLAAENGRGLPMRWYFRPDGKLDGEADTDFKGTVTDEGKWWVTPFGALCMQWENWAEARRRCAVLTVGGNRIQPYGLADGAPLPRTWEIKKQGPGTAQIIAGLGSGGAQQIARAQPVPAPMAPRPVVAADATPPVIDAPATLSTDNATVEVTGRVSDASQIVELSVNGRPVAVASDGAFSFSRGMPTGTSKLTVVAVDEWGNRGEKEITVIRKAQQLASTRSVRAVDDKAPNIDVPPSLETRGASVTIEGRVADASQIIEVTVNGRPIPLQKNGSFRLNRGVPSGASEIVVAAVDEWGNRAERRIAVQRVQAAQPEWPKAVAASAVPKPEKPKDPFAGIYFGNYHALVIGNNRYQHLQKLQSARNDADAVSKVLSDHYGFKVTQIADATRSDILGTLAKFRATLKPDDNLLIYYAGHGVVDNVTEQGYWLPVDAEEQNPSNWISNADLTSMLRAIRARHVMVVADSCYSGTLVRAASATLKTAHEKVQWVKRMLQKRGRTALVSGGLEPVTDSGEGNHSVFASAFMAALTENREVMEGRELFDRLKRPVVLNADQTPRYSDIRQAGHEGGEFVFVRRTKQ